MMEKIDSCHLTFAQGWVSSNMIFGSGYLGAMTCTTALVDTDCEVYNGPTNVIFATVSFN